MRRAWISLMLFLSFPFVVLAQSDTGQTQADPARVQIEAQMRRIESALSRIISEQQSLYQQFQMLQEMRRSELQRTQESAMSYTPPPSPPNYEDLVREREAREERIQRYGDELDRLYARYRDLDSQKQPLLDALSQLALDSGG